MDKAELVTRIWSGYATGCRGAAGYLDWAREHGYTRCEVLNDTSSAGDWEFLVSKNGFEWYILCQSNNWPHAGFSYSLNDWAFYGDLEDVYQEIEMMYG